VGYSTTFSDKGGKPRFNLKAGNHQVILASEGYESTSARNNGIKSVQKNSQSADRFEKRTSKKGDPYFVLKAKNGEIIGRSEMYSSMSACNKGIKSVMTNGSSTVVKAV